MSNNVKKFNLSELVELFGGDLSGDNITISGIAPIETASENSLSFVSDKKYLAQLVTCPAPAFIINKEHIELVNKLNLNKPLIITNNPQLYMAKVSGLFYMPALFVPVIKDSAIIDSSTDFADKGSVLIQDYVVIGANTRIGKNTQILAGCIIGDNVTIGDNIILYSNVTIYSNVVIGDNTIIHSGAVIGADGFGNALDERKQWHKIPQVGGVRIGSNVEIGANTTIDGGTFSPTIIGDGVRIDNLVQIGHNVEVGDHTALAACSGIAGSTKIGKYCQFGGGSGVTGHVEIVDHCVIGGGTLISKSLTKPDLYFSVYPFSTLKEWAKNAFHVKNLNSIYLRVKGLEAKIEQLLEQKQTMDK